MVTRRLTRFPERDLSNQRFGRWTVLHFAGYRFVGAARKAFWRCSCDCGNLAEVAGNNLTSGGSKSCGCLTSVKCAKRNMTHGMSGTRTYRAWSAMLTRCTNPRIAQAKDYSDRGITVSDEWRNSFEQFLADMGLAPSGSHSLDRIDNSRGYDRTNCRWATAEQQNNNRRSNRHITANGMRLTLAQWSRRSGISLSTINYRLSHGWSPDMAVTVLPSTSNRKEVAE